MKHANPCGVAVADDLSSAYDRAFHTDTESAFGGIIAFNRELDGATAAAIVERQFVEVIIAPEVSSDAIAAVSAKENVRLLRTGQWSSPLPARDFKRVNGGLLLQDRDDGTVTRDDLTVSLIEHPPRPNGWTCCSPGRWPIVKSNAIIYAANQRTIGVGAGQMSRVNSARIAAIEAEHAGLQVKGAVMASDAFFAFGTGSIMLPSAASLP